MKSRWLGILLIASFAFWATGAAHWVHEALEHEGISVCAACAVSPDDGEQPAHSHSHDDCAVCQTLAAMTATRSAPPVHVDFHALSPHTLRLIQFAPRVLCVAWLEPSCGPPAAPAMAV